MFVEYLLVSECLLNWLIYLFFCQGTLVKLCLMSPAERWRMKISACFSLLAAVLDYSHWFINFRKFQVPSYTITLINKDFFLPFLFSIVEDIFCRLFLRRKLSNLQWMAIILLAVGTTTSQVNFLINTFYFIFDLFE